MKLWVVMKNITISVDDELYRQARIKAAERSESISSLFWTFLMRLTASPGGESELERLQRESALGARAPSPIERQLRNWPSSPRCG